MHPICRCLAPGEPITQIGSHAARRQRGSIVLVHVHGNANRRDVLVRSSLREPNDIDPPPLDSIRAPRGDTTSLSYPLSGDNHAIGKECTE